MSYKNIGVIFVSALRGSWLSAIYLTDKSPNRIPFRYNFDGYRIMVLFYRPDNKMKFYVPLKVFESEVFKTLYASLIEAKLVKDISANIKHEHDICSTKEISTEFKHNKLIQEKYFKSDIYMSSNPLYIWHKDRRVHISSFNGGMEKVKLLEVSLIATKPEHVEGIFYIIEFSFWRDFTVQHILPWIAQHYNTLSDLNMRVIRLPDVAGMSLPSLLKLGLYKDNTVNILNGYYLWNGSSAEVWSQLVYARDNSLSSQAIIKKLGPETDKYYDDITKHISIIEQQLEPVRDKQETINEKPLTVTVNNTSIYTPEAIIAKFGRKEAAALAQAILNKLLE